MALRVFRAHWLALLVSSVTIFIAHAQSKDGIGAVSGHVLCSDTQQPARLAHVVLQPVVDLNSPLLKRDDHSYHPEGDFHLETVSLDGSFTISAVPPGHYYVIVEQDGYVSPLALFTRAQLNEPDEPLKQRIARYMTVVSVIAGHTTQAEVTLIRGAVIAGMVHFEDGSPAINVGLQLLQRDDKGKWQTARTQKLASHNFGGTYTDDQGAYRFSGLPAGEYIVRANIELNNVEVSYIFGTIGSSSYGDGYHLRIYPGDAFRPGDAKPVKVEDGESATSVDVDIPLSKLYTLSGTVLRPDSELPANAAHLSLAFADTGEELTSTEVNLDDGTFRFDFVPGGNYVLRATNVANVERTEAPTCKGCMPATRTETKVLTRFGDASLPIELTSDQTPVVVQATAAAKAVASHAQ
jgi:hypothetical protein